MNEAGKKNQLDAASKKVSDIEKNSGLDSLAQKVNSSEDTLTKAKADKDAKMNAVDQANVTEQAKNTALANAKGGGTVAAKEAKDQANQSAKDSQDKIQKGVAGPFQYVLDDANSTPAQKADEQLALDRVNGTQERTDWFDKVDLSDQKDATSYTGLKNSLSYYDTVNGIRKANNLNELGVSLAAVAGSMPNCSYSGQVQWGHAQTYKGTLEFQRLLLFSACKKSKQVKAQSITFPRRRRGRRRRQMHIPPDKDERTCRSSFRR